MQERIQKIISAAGIASRRAAEKLILEGRVTVSGKVVTELGTKADPGKEHIKVDGKLINPRQPKTYIMLNKPAGYVTTMSDPEKRATVQDLLKGVRVRVYPVGRLDYNTEGLLLMTNDGDFANLIMHPRNELPKTYLVKIKGVLEDKAAGDLERGVYLEDGKTAPAKIRKIRKEEANSWIEVVIHEGKKRQVRRMLERVGHSVIRLKRTKIGSLTLGALPIGAYSHLTPAEVKGLREMAEGKRDEGRQTKDKGRGKIISSGAVGGRGQTHAVARKKPETGGKIIRSGAGGGKGQAPAVARKKPETGGRKRATKRPLSHPRPRR